MKKLRKISHQVHWIVIFIFVGTIFLVWGMQYGYRYIDTKAIVGNTPVTKVEYERYYQRWVNIYRKIYGDDFKPELIPNFRETVFQELINQKIISKEGKRMGFVAFKDEVTIFLMHEFKDPSIMAAVVKFQPPSFTIIGRKLLKEEIITHKVKEILDKVSVSNQEVFEYFKKNCGYYIISHILIKPEELIPQEEMKSYYEKFKEEFKKPPDLHIKRIYFKLEKDKEKEIREKIHQLHSQITEGKQDFEKLAKDLGTLTFDQIPKEIRSDLYALGVGNISIPLATKEGIGIYKVVSKGTEGIREFNDPEVIQRIKSALKDEYEKDAEDLAKKVYKKAKKAQEEFAKLAKVYSHATTSAIFGGYVGLIPQRFIFSGQEKKFQLVEKCYLTYDGKTIIEEVSKELRKLKEEEISKPIKTHHGFHIIKLHKIIPPSMQEYKSVRGELQEILKSQKSQRLFVDWLNYLKNKYRVETR